MLSQFCLDHHKFPHEICSYAQDDFCFFELVSSSETKVLHSKLIRIKSIYMLYIFLNSWPPISILLVELEVSGWLLRSYFKIRTPTRSLFPAYTTFGGER